MSWNGVPRENREEHINVYIDHYGDIPEGHHVHHIDNNHENNNPANLIALPRAFHLELHNNYSFYYSIAQRGLVDRSLLQEILHYSRAMQYPGNFNFCIIIIEFLLSHTSFSYLQEKAIINNRVESAITRISKPDKPIIMSLDDGRTFTSFHECAMAIGVHPGKVNNLYHACNSLSHTCKQLRGKRVARIGEDGLPILNIKKQSPKLITSEEINLSDNAILTKSIALSIAELRKTNSKL